MKSTLAIALTMLTLTACASKTEHETTLESAYDKFAPQQAVICRQKEIGVRTFVLCENMLWLVEGERYFAVNGSARAVVERMGDGFFEYQIPVDFDINEILGQF